MNENITNEKELIRKNQIEILEMKSSISITEIKNIIESFNSRLDQVKKRISDLEDF